MFIRTERLFLRPAWREDAPTLARLLGQPGVQHELTGPPWLEALGDADHFLASGGSRDVRLLVFRRTEGGPKLIGTAGVGQPLEDRNSVRSGKGVLVRGNLGGRRK